uniref:WD_REPEATS_REGION domain-containing protein n=1 Tax=Elaeophora elaphi TaxID=1147741 RepID=A0A0R3RZ08_9BILA
MDGTDTPDIGFRAAIIQQLERRNVVCRQFDSLFSSYGELTEYVANIARTGRIRTGSSTSLAGSSDRTMELEAELADLYRKKEQNDQQLIETNNRLGVVTRELSAVSIVKEECQKENQKLKKKLKEKEEELAALVEANTLLKDEHFALQASYNSIENKYREAQEERNNLVERIKELKEKEVQWFNEQNEREQEQRRRRLAMDIESALNMSHNNEDKTYGFEIISSANQVVDYRGDMIPAHCKAKLEYGDDINDILWHPNGKMFAGGGSDHKLRLYNVIDDKFEKIVSLAGSNESILRIDFSAETSQVLGAGNDNAVRIWGTDNHVVKHSLTGHGNKVSSAKFFQDGLQVVSGSYDRTFKLWDLKTAKCLRTYFTNSVVYDITSSDKTGMVASGHYDRKVRFWDTRLNEPVHAVELANKVTSLVVSLDCSVILVSSRDETMSLIDLRSYQIVHIYSADQYRTGSDHIRCTISPGMKYIASGSSDGAIFIWNLKTTKLEKTLQKGGHERGVHSVSWHPKGNMLLSAGKEKTVCLWTV